MFTETTRLVRDREIGGKGVWRQGKRKIINQSLHCHHQNDSCIKMGSNKSHFNVSLIVRDKVSNKPVSTDHNFWRERRAEVDSNRGPSSYQPNALPLGQTGSQNNDAINVCFYPSVFRWVQRVRCYENCYHGCYFTFSQLKSLFHRFRIISGRSLTSQKWSFRDICFGHKNAQKVWMQTGSCLTSNGKHSYLDRQVKG